MSLAKVFGLLLMVVCFVALHTDAAYQKPIEDDDDDEESEPPKPDEADDMPGGKEIKLEHLFVALASLSVETVVPAGMGIVQNCKCTGLTCKCCHNVKAKNVESCLVLTYTPADKTVAVSVTFGGKTVHETKFPVSDPPDICSSLSQAKVCLNFTVDSKKLIGCARLSLYFSGVKLVTYDLGCFENKLPTPGPAKLLPTSTPKSKSASKPTSKPKSTSKPTSKPKPNAKG